MVNHASVSIYYLIIPRAGIGCCSSGNIGGALYVVGIRRRFPGCAASGGLPFRYAAAAALGMAAQNVFCLLKQFLSDRGVAKILAKRAGRVDGRAVDPDFVVEVACFGVTGIGSSLSAAGYDLSGARAAVVQVSISGSNSASLAGFGEESVTAARRGAFDWGLCGDRRTAICAIVVPPVGARGRPHMEWLVEMGVHGRLDDDALLCLSARNG